MKTDSNIVKGSLFALVAFFFMALFGITTKEALKQGSFVWVSFTTYLTGTIALIPYIAWQGLGYLKSRHYLSLFGRAFFGTMASFCYTISLNYIPIVNGTLLFNTAPLFIPLLATLFLKVKIKKWIWFAIAIGFIGILIIIKPTQALFTQTGNLIGLYSGFSLAVAYLLMKLLTDSDPGIRIIFYYLGLGTLFHIPLLIFMPFALSFTALLYAILSGLLLLIAQIALVNGYKYASASEIGIYQYATVAFVGLLDWLLWNVIPAMSDILGIILVAMAGIIVIRSGNNRS